MRAILGSFIAWLPVRLRRHATAERVEVLAQFLSFGVIGFLGFLVDTAVVYATRAALGLYLAGIAGFLVAVTVNWVLNRVWTFRGHGGGPAHRQWGRYIAVNLLGFVLNRGTYALLVTFVPLCAAEPVWAVAAGALVGLAANFPLTRLFVFGLGRGT